MKTYQDYYNEWELSTESRDLAFDEWLMLLLDRKEKQMIKKAWEWLKQLPKTWDIYEESHYTIDRDSLIEEFLKAMEE